MDSARPNLLLDLGGVLVGVDHSRAVEAFGRIAGADPDRVRRTIYKSGLIYQFELGEIDIDQFRRTVAESLGTEIKDDIFDRAWCSTLYELENIAGLLARLSGTFSLFVLSNTNPIHFEAIREMFPSWMGLMAGFHLSYEIGLQKPSREFFEAALKRFSLDNRSCVFVDDDPDNVRGAAAVGLRSHKVSGPGLDEDELRAWKLL